MKLLAIETATEGCSAALSINGTISSRFEVAPRRHAELILPMCESLLSEAGIEMPQLDAIAFGRGPGSFTGVRIAASVAQGLACALELPVVPISTLAALAQGVMTEEGRARVLAAIDARMGEIYWGCYHRDALGCARLDGEERVGKLEQVAIRPEPGWFGAGSGWAAYGDLLRERLDAALDGFDDSRLPQARHTISLAEVAYDQGASVSAEQALPVYLRDEVARKSKLT
jgi:tRNA threonylcarbamoyladenosine biosynthesis protein TsaB